MGQQPVPPASGRSAIWGSSRAAQVIERITSEKILISPFGQS